MESLSHFMLSLVGVMLWYYAVKEKPKWYIIPLLVSITVLIDIDHLLPKYEITKILIFHNLISITAVAVAVGMFIKKSYGILLWILLFGHLLMDMNNGIYGVPLFYPILKTTYLIPDSWSLYLFNDESYPVITKVGISLTIYFGLILAYISKGFLSSHKV